MSDFVKQRPGAPDGFFAAEAAGLTWLAEPAAAPVVDVLDSGADFVRLERLTPGRPTADAARTFGAQLARLHDAGADGFGWAPSATAWFGPLEDPFEVPTTSHQDFSTFWAEDRLRPLAHRATVELGRSGGEQVEGAIDTIASGTFDGIAGEGSERPSRVHGDLWSGNLMWTANGGTLIDPSAHGGHRLEDLAMLSMFGAPHLQEIYAGYAAEHTMPGDWQQDLPAHLFFGLLAHVVLFGGGYASQAVHTAEQISRRAADLGA